MVHFECAVDGHIASSKRSSAARASKTIVYMAFFLNRKQARRLLSLGKRVDS